MLKRNTPNAPRGSCPPTPTYEKKWDFAPITFEGLLQVHKLPMKNGETTNKRRTLRGFHGQPPTPNPQRTGKQTQRVEFGGIFGGSSPPAAPTPLRTAPRRWCARLRDPGIQSSQKTQRNRSRGHSPKTGPALQTFGRSFPLLMSLGPLRSHRTSGPTSPPLPH